MNKEELLKYIEEHSDTILDAINNLNEGEEALLGTNGITFSPPKVQINPPSSSGDEII